MATMIREEPAMLINGKWELPYKAKDRHEWMLIHKVTYEDTFMKDGKMHIKVRYDGILPEEELRVSRHLHELDNKTL